MHAWGVDPPDVALRFTEEQLLELVPAMQRRIARESLAAQLAPLFSGAPAPEAPARPGRTRRDRKLATGRTERTWGSSRQPLAGAELERAVSDMARLDRSGKGRVH